MRMKRILSLFIILSIVLCSSIALSGAAIVVDTRTPNTVMMIEKFLQNSGTDGSSDSLLYM